MLQSNAHSISIIAHPAPTSPLLTTFSFSVMPMTQTTQSYRNYAGESHSILRNFNDETPSLFADDIITPVYVAPTRSPTTFRPKHHKENIQERPSCDDEEDCEEGSGEPVTTEEIFVTSTTGPFYLIFLLILSLLISFFFSSLSLSLFFFYFISSFPSTLVFRTLDLNSRTKHTITLSVLIFHAWFPFVHFLCTTTCRRSISKTFVCAVFDRFLLTEYASEICSMASLKWRF